MGKHIYVYIYIYIYIYVYPAFGAPNQGVGSQGGDGSRRGAFLVDTGSRRNVYNYTPT